MKKRLLLLCIVFINLFTLSVNALDLSQVVKGTTNYLVTTYDDERFARFFINGNVVNVEGRFTNDIIEEFIIGGSVMLSESKAFTRYEDGSFRGYFGGIPSERIAYVKLGFKSGKILTYRIEYNEGWYFPVNGLDKYTDYNRENYITVSDEISAAYVCDELDVARTRETLERLRNLAFEITEGEEDDYKKAKLLSFWVSENIYYDYDAKNKGITLATVSLENILETKRTICIGFANLYSALLQAVGIKAVNISGGVTNENCTYEELAVKTAAHEWVAFWYEAEKRWVNTDVVFDRFNSYKNGKYEKKDVLMQYFDMDSLTLSLNHRGDKAELRNYLGADEYVQSGKPPQSETEAQITEATESKATEVLPQDTIPVADRDDFFPPEAEDLTVFYIAVMVLAIGVASAAVILIIILKNKKGSM